MIGGGLEKEGAPSLLSSSVFCSCSSRSSSSSSCAAADAAAAAAAAKEASSALDRAAIAPLSTSRRPRAGKVLKVFGSEKKQSVKKK